jgi:MerR, DNA binding
LISPRREPRKIVAVTHADAGDEDPDSAGAYAYSVRRLNFIRHARDLGFSVEDIRELLALSTRPDQPCGNIDKIAARYLAAVDLRIAQLTALRTELTRMLDQCEGSSVAECCVIESLAH